MKIGFFGCSFTEGGGLNSPNWNEYAIKHNLIPKSLKGRCGEVMKKYRYSTLIGNELNCEVKNFAISGGSNETILNLLFDNYDNFDICVFQFTMFDRMKIYDDKTSSFYDINGKEANAPKNVINYFLKTITEHQSRDYEIYKVKQVIKLYDNIFEKINKKIIWLFADMIEDVQSKNVIYLEPIGLHKYMVENKYTFKQVTNEFYDDWHWAPTGHRHLAKKIMEKIDE